LTRTERYATAYPYQTVVDVQVYQGDDEDALRNVLVGDFRIEGLTPTEEPNEILCRMHLDLDGILEVAALEKRTGASKHVTIANALRARSAEEIAAGQRRIRELYESRGEILDQSWTTPADVDEAVLDTAPAVNGGREVTAMGTSPVPSNGDLEARHLLERSRRLLDSMHADDREAAIELHEKIETAIDVGSASELQAASQALEELLFFVEGQR
jgi:molecular chaperone DnaK